MTGKYPGEITEIALDSATYKGTGAVIRPTYINYFFGNNGTGKSTIARTIENGSGLSYSHGRTPADYLVLVYNQDFINRNIQEYHNLPGVFTMAEANADIQKQIDELTEKQTAAKQKSSDAASEAKKKEHERTALKDQLCKDCWDTTAGLRDEYEQTQDGFRKSKEKFVGEIQKHQAVQHDLQELKRTYDSVYGETAKSYQTFNTVEDTAILDSVPDDEILSLAIVNTSNTPFAEFLKEIGATEWVRQGHESYHALAKDKCPYCSETLPADFEKRLAASFDNQYQKNLERLNAFLDAYKQKSEDLLLSLSSTPEEVYPPIVMKPYTEKLAVLRAVIAANIDLINKKVAKPTEIISLGDTSELLVELSDIIFSFNSLIDKNNAIVAAGPQKKRECTNAVFERMRFDVDSIINDYHKKDTALETEIATQQTIMAAQDDIVKKCSGEIKELNTHTVETETAMRRINETLRDSGFQGFELRPHREEGTADGSDQALSSSPINYEVVRTETGEIASNLSEGEKNFIAFMYFQQLVSGSQAADGETRDKIVVIDDPVSSMDSGTLFIVSAQIRRMIEICRNNADDRNPVVPGKYIKQIFILTHNAYFHREVTYPYANRYEFVSFYLIHKIDNKSRVQLCDRMNPDCPTTRINVNPVKNNYAALWDEYKENIHGIPLMNVIRRILEYYFLQLCGYDGNDLRERILQNCKYALTHDEHGNEDYSKYALASAMLSYITVSSDSISDGMNYVDYSIDTDLYRSIFEMIFREMHQGQHFDMMMGLR